MKKKHYPLKSNPQQTITANVRVENEEHNISVLQTEYEQTIESYNYRDQLVPEEFNITLAVLVGIIGVTELADKPIGAIGSAFLFFIGAITLYVLHNDMMSNSSVKQALRDHIIDIEKELQKITNLNNPTLFGKIIAERPKSKLEKVLKPVSSSVQIVWIVRLLLVSWVVYAGLRFGLLSILLEHIPVYAIA